jgi:hypothetical protein
MDVNKIQIAQNGFTNKGLTIPIQLSWDYLGLDQSIDEYETQVITEVIGVGRDFEVTRFVHAAMNEGPQVFLLGGGIRGGSQTSAPVIDDLTDIQYEFNFFSGGSLSATTNWACNYQLEGFTTDEIYYYTNNFSNSFFKLDLYDSTDDSRQTNYITIIIPTQQGLTMDAVMQRTPVKIKKPYFVLDYVGDKEGFFIYWLKKRTFLDIKTFFMTAKFFDAKQGVFVKMMNMSQAEIAGDKYSFDSSQYFYYRVELDYEKHNYQVFNINPHQHIYDSTAQRAGSGIPIKWYEYVNP